MDFAIKMKWFYGHSENNAGNPVTIDDIGSSSNRDFIIFHCCEELELLSRDYSNDEGGDSSMAAGPQGDTGTENPDFLIQKGLAKSALHRVPLPSVCWNNPLPENTPGLLQKAFPHVCKSGDGDPYQDRPRCIREPASTWMKHYLEWFAKQPAAQKDPRCQFYIHNRDSRNEVRETTKLAIRHCGLDMENLPTNEELLKDATKRAEIEKKITSMSSKVRDSDGYWQKIGQGLIGYSRYAEDPPSYRVEVPQNFIFFQTRALPYNHHPAIQRLYPNFARVSKLSDDDYFKARKVNTLEFPHIVQWDGTFMAELNVNIASPTLYDTNRYFVRSEWGANGNPHFHQLQASEKLSAWFQSLKEKFREVISALENKFNDEHGDKPPSKEELSVFGDQIETEFKRIQTEYMDRMKNYYTNWNSGYTKNGIKIFSKFDVRTTVARADMEALIDQFLCTGVSKSIDEVYVSIQNATMRHINHSGPKYPDKTGCYPSKKDRCAVKIKIVDKTSTKEKEKKWEESGKKGKKPKIVHKEVYTCKRRMPQPLFDKPTIYQDPFKKEITQFCTERNDGWINGGCKFSMLLNLNNVDDKIIVEEWLMKVPKVKWLESKKKVQVLTSKCKGGQLPEEYSAKYVTKGIPTRGVKGDILLACVQRMEPENEVNMGTFTKINNFVNKRGNIPIFNAVHGNLKLPLVFQNFNIKECSVLGLS